MTRVHADRKRAGGREKTPPRGGRPVRAGRPAVDTPAPGIFGRYPVAISLGVIALSLIIFFFPMIFGGKVFLPPDTIASQSHQTYIQEVMKGGEYPLWTPYVFSGMPSLGSLIAAPYTNPMSLVLTPLGANLKLVTYYFLIGLFTFLLARRRVKSNFAALFAAISFVYCAQVIGWIMAGHNSKLATCVFLPAIILLVDRLLEKPSITTAAWTALAVGLSIVTSHMQITFYSMTAAGVLLAVTTIARLRTKTAGRETWLAWALFVVAVLVGLGTSAVVSLPVREYAHYSIRGAGGAGLSHDYATSWSLHPFEMMTFLIPAFFGFGNQTYWGWMPFTEAPQYMGILPLFLAILGFALRRRERFTIYLAVLGVLALFVSFGKEFPVLYDPLFKFMPFFNQFRVPSMALVLTQISVAVLAALGLDALLEPVNETERARRAALTRKVTFIFGAVLVAAGLFVLVGRGWLTSVAAGHIASKVGGGPAGELARDALNMGGRDFLIVLVFFAIGAGAIWALAKRSLSRNVALPVILLVTIADLWIVGLKPARYQPAADKTDVFQATRTVQYLQNDHDLFRILPLQAPLSPTNGPSNWWAYFKLQNAWGYHPAKLKVYQDMLDDQGPFGLTKPLAGGNFNLLKLTNVRYLIFGQPGLEQSTHLELAYSSQGTTASGRTVGEYVYRLKDELPRAHFVDRYRVIADPKALLTAMADPAFDPAAEALLLAEPGGTIDPAASGSVTITDYRPQHIRADVTASGNKFLVMSEVWYPPGWKATLDGKPLPIIRTDYAFRGFLIPAGTHKLAMDFSDPAFVLGRTISIAAYALVAVILLTALVGSRLRPAKPSRSPEPGERPGKPEVADLNPA